MKKKIKKGLCVAIATSVFMQTGCIVQASELSGKMIKIDEITFNISDVDEYVQEGNPIQIGKNVYATVNGKMLTISGTGKYTYDYSDQENWCSNAAEIDSVIFEDNLEYIGNYFFDNFTSLKEITFPTNLKEIGENSFQNCSSLERIVLPEGVEKIGNGIFTGCISLKSISFPSTLKKISTLSRNEDLGSLETVIISNGVEEIARFAFLGCCSLEKINIPDGMKIIGEGAFAGTSKLKALQLPDSIEIIGSGAFSNSTFFECGIERLSWPSNVKIIESGTFSECKNLKEIVIPEGVTEIGNVAFSDCSSLEGGLVIPQSVTTIGRSAFAYCGKLESICIPKSVTYIGEEAFNECKNLTVYSYKDSIAEKYADNNQIPFVSMDYRVVFKDNGRTIKTEYVFPGENATPPQLTKDGYKLSWYGDYTNVQEDMVINAVWTKENENHGGTVIVVTPTPDKKYTVTFKDRDRIIKTEKVLSGEAADYPCIQRYGYELSWDKDFSKVTEDMTVNAVWTILKPEKVSNVTASIVSKKIQLTWDETDYAGYYKIYRKKSSENKFVLLDQTTKTLFKDTTAKENTEYQYKIVAVRSAEGKMYAGQESVIVTAKVKIPIIGKTYSVEGIKYKVGKSHSVAVQGLTDSLNEIHIPGTVQIFGEIFKVKSIDHKAFYKNPDITTVTIGNNVTYIGKYSFYGCDSLKKVMFGNNVTTISTRAFTGCKNLGNVTLHSKLKVLGAEVFYKCPKVKQVVIKSGYLNYVGKKGLMIEKNAVIKVPEKMYASYVKIIEASGKYSETKIRII